MPENENLEQKKETAILAIAQLAEEDYNNLLDAIILVATAAKKKTSTGLIGLKAIINQKEPEPTSKPETKNDME